MKIRNIKGQEATEFVLVALLVFFASLLVVLFLGGQLASFFGKDSTIANTSNNKAQVYTTSSAKDYKPALDNYAGVNTYAAQNTGTTTPGEPRTISINGQDYTIPGDTISRLDTALSIPSVATGSPGTDAVIADIKYMAEKFNAPPEDIQLLFGSSNHIFDCSGKCNRDPNNVSGHTINGTAELNMVAIKYGDNIIVRNMGQNPQDGTWGQYYQGLQLRLEGKIGTNNVFSSAVSGQSSSINEGVATTFQGGSYNSQVQVTPDGGLIFQSGNINLNHPEYKVYGKVTHAPSTVKPTGKLELKFDKPKYNFTLGPATTPKAEPIPTPIPSNSV